MWTGQVPPAPNSARGLLGWGTSISLVILSRAQGHPGFSVPPTFLLLAIHHLLLQGLV